MTAILIAAPAVEPVSAAEMRGYLRLDGDDELGLVAALIRSARLSIEAASGCVLIEQGWRLRLANVAGGALRSPLAPLIAVDRVQLTEGGAVRELAADAFRIDDAADPPRILVEPPLRPGARVEIDLRAGFGPAPETVPEPLRQAIRLLVAHWFENRGDAGPRPLPAEIGKLVAPYRRARL